MADRHAPYDIDPELEEQLAGQRDRIAYPQMSDSVTKARERIESAARPAHSGAVVEPVPFDAWDDENVTDETATLRPVIDVTQRQLGRLRQAFTLAAAAVAIFIVGGLLIAVLPGVIDDDQTAAPAVLGPDTTGYQFAGTIGGPIVPNEPVDVAVDSAGNIYAADIATRSILKFDPQGEFLASWKADDAEVGPFMRPWSLVIQDGTLYVLDQQQKAIYQLDTDGNVLNAWRAGNPEDPADLYYGMDVNQHGHIYITNANSGTIDIFESTGARIASFRVTDDPQNGGERPLDIAVDDYGLMFITSFASDDIRILDTTGTQIDRVLTSDYVVPDLSFEGITLGEDGFLYLNSDRMVFRFEPSTLEIREGWSSDDPVIGSAAFPSQGVGVDGNGVIYIADTIHQRIAAYNVGPGGMVLEIKDARQDHFATPGGIKVDDEGSLHVVDSRSQRVTKFAPDGTVLNSWTWETESPTRVDQMPGDAALTADHLYVLDGVGEAIVQVTYEGEKIHEWAGELIGDNAWHQPLSLHADVNGNLYLSDWGTAKILKYDGDGQFIADWAPMGIERQDPRGFNIRGDTVYVAYAGGSMPGIWTLDLDGNVIERVVEFANSDESIDTIPLGLAVAPTGDMFTIDAFSDTVRWYTPDGELKSEWQITPDIERVGGFMSIAVSDTGTIYVSDGDTRQILVFEPASG